MILRRKANSKRERLIKASRKLTKISHLTKGILGKIKIDQGWAFRKDSSRIHRIRLIKE